MSRRFPPLALLVLLLAGCPLIGPSGGAPEIRVANRSDRDFSRVLVRFESQDEEYGPLPAGAVSGYRTVDRAYRYAYVEVRVDTARLVLQPIDFVGESLLGRGRYTYALTVTDDGRSLGLELERD